MLSMLREKAAKELLTAVSGFDSGIDYTTVLASLNIAKPEFADLYSNILFKLAPKAKESGVSLSELAESIIAKLKPALPEFDITFSNNYVNFTLNINGCLRVLYSKPGFIGKKQTYLLEYPSVNPNKPWHIGHLRNALIGQSIANLLRAVGKDVIVIDYIDDLGLQFAQTIHGLQELGLFEQFRAPKGERADFFLGKVYVDAAAKVAEGSEEVKRIVKSMEKDSEFLLKSRKIAEACVRGQYATASKFRVSRDLLVFESDVVTSLLDEGISVLKQNRIITKVEDPEDKLNGCYCIDVSSFKESKDGKKVLIRSDGTLTYTGKDLIFHMWKYGLLKDKMAYSKFSGSALMTSFYSDSSEKVQFSKPVPSTGLLVVGNEQAFPQKVLAFALKELGYSVNHVHVSYAHVKLKDSRFSGRKGTWVGFTAEDLLAEGIEREKEKIKDKKPGWEHIAEVIGTSSIKYFILKHSPEKEIVFDWDKALALEGNSAPYILYSVVRAKAVFRKAGIEIETYSPAKVPEVELHPKEAGLLRLMARHSAVLEQAAGNYSINSLTDYVFELATAFNMFYNECQILTDERHKARRLAILKQYHGLMVLLLGVLNIEIPDWM